MSIFKVSTGWLGTTGGPGLTQMYFQDVANGNPSQTQAQTTVNAVRAFWAAINGILPNELTLTVSPQIDVYDQLDGELVASIVAATPPTSVVGLDSGVYSMASGVKANLQTNEIRNGRRVRGSVYIVPAGASAMTNTGNISSGTRTSVNTAGNAIISSVISQNVNWIVWGRPVKDDAGNLTRNGSVNFIQAVDTAEKGCILRGRRD